MPARIEPSHLGKVPFPKTGAPRPAFPPTAVRRRIGEPAG
jgi:hypothetical protein